MKSVLEILSREQLKELRDNGWVVVNREPTEAMGKAFYGKTYPELINFEQAYHRMIAASIRHQNEGEVAQPRKYESPSL